MSSALCFPFRGTYFTSVSQLAHLQTLATEQTSFQNSPPQRSFFNVDQLRNSFQAVIGLKIRTILPGAMIEWALHNR